MQNYGFEEGIPGTLYWKGIQAKYTMIEYMTKRLHRALEEEAQAGKDSTSILAKFVRCLKEEGYDVYQNGTCTQQAAEELAKEVVMLNFAATENSSYALCQATMLLARHPEWFDAIWEEQKELIAQYGEDTIDRKVRCKSSLKHFCTLFSCIYE